LTEVITGTLTDARKLIDEVEGLPTLPTVVSELLERSSDPDATVGGITEIIENDPALNAKILKLVNSAFYGLPRRISALQTAVSILGFNAIRNIVLATSILNLFSKRRMGFDSEGFWIHCLSCGVACNVLGRRLDESAERSDFVYGLLHDVGKILLAVHKEDVVRQVLQTVRKKRLAFCDAEREVLGVTHAQVGAALAEKWRFPEGLIHAIRYHHNVDAAGPGFTEAALVHVADTLIRALQLGWCGDDRICPVSETAWDALKLTDADVGPVMDDVHSGLVGASPFIDLILDPQHA